MVNPEYSNWGNDLYFYKKAGCVICGQPFYYVPLAVYTTMRSQRIWSTYLEVMQNLFAPDYFPQSDEVEAEIWDYRISAAKKEIKDAYELKHAFEMIIPCWKCFEAHKKKYREIYLRIIGDGIQQLEGYTYKVGEIARGLLVEILALAKEHFKDREIKKDTSKRDYKRTMDDEQFKKLMGEIKNILNKIQPEPMKFVDAPCSSKSAVTVEYLAELLKQLPKDSLVLVPERNYNTNTEYVNAKCEVKQMFYHDDDMFNSKVNRFSSIRPTVAGNNTIMSIVIGRGY